MDGKKIFGAFVVAIALFFFWPVVFGSWQEIGALKAAVSERQDLVTQRKEVLANVSSLYTNYKNKLTAQDSLKFSSLIPVRKDSAELISAIQSIANDSSLTVKEIRDLAAALSNRRVEIAVYPPEAK